MELNEQTIKEFAKLVAEAVVSAINVPNNIGIGANNKADKPKSAFKKTEQLLFNYKGFKKIIADREQEIEELRKYGTPETSKSIVAYTPKTNSVQGTVLPEESVESAVCRIHCAVERTVQVVTLIEKCMAALKNDPYYKTLEMRYFEGKTLEEIAFEFKCDHSTISRNKNRLVKELSMQLFPDDVINEILENVYN